MTDKSASCTKRRIAPTVSRCRMGCHWHLHRGVKWHDSTSPVSQRCFFEASSISSADFGILGPSEKNGKTLDETAMFPYTFLMKLLANTILIVICTAAHAQTQIFNPISVAGDKIKRLRWNTAEKLHSAEFGVTGSFQLNGWVPVRYKFLGQNVQFNNGGVWQSTIESTEATVTARIVGPGLGSIKLDVLARNTGTNIHVTWPGNNTEYLVAAGGAFSFTPTGSNVAHYTYDFVDDLPYMKAYTQYFRDPSIPLQQHEQSPQGAIVALPTNQPGTTTVTWTIGSMYTSSPTTFAPLVPLSLFPTSTSDTKIRANLNVTWVDTSDRRVNNAPAPLNETLTATIEDCTEETEFLFYGVWYKKPTDIAAFTPTSLVLIEKQLLNYSPGGSFNGGTGASREYYLQLFDQTGKRMPAVWMNEHFPTPANNPPNFRINDTSEFWTSDGFVSPSPRNRQQVISLAIDLIKYYWYPLATPWSSYSTPHSFHAATKATDGSGLYIGTRTIYLIPGAPNTRANVGQ